MSTPKNTPTPPASQEAASNPLTVSPTSPPTLLVPEEFAIQTATGEFSNLRFNSYGDLILQNPSRVVKGVTSKNRALTIGFSAVGAEGKLIINFEKDFPNGVRLDGQVQLKDLKQAPPNVATDRVVVDSDGNLYKQD